jgi:anthranilate synthase component 1
MYYPNREEFKKRAKKGNLVPVYREILADMETPVSAFKKIGKSPYAFLLESVEGGEQMARYSFLGADPFLVFTSKGKGIAIEENGAIQARQLKDGEDPLTVLKELFGRYHWVCDESLPPFAGGAVGYIGYDTVRFFEELPNQTEDDLELPDCYFVFTDTLLIFDHVQHRIKVLSHALVNGDPDLAYDKAISRIEALIERLNAPLPAYHKPAKTHSA